MEFKRILILILVLISPSFLLADDTLRSVCYFNRILPIVEVSVPEALSFLREGVVTRLVKTHQRKDRHVPIVTTPVMLTGPKRQKIIDNGKLKAKDGKQDKGQLFSVFSH